MGTSSSSDKFSGRVAVLFGTQVVGAGIGIVNGILLARLLGPAAKGDYYLLVLVPSTLMVFVQLGLQQAFGFFAARGQTTGLVTKSIVLTLALSLVAIVAVVILQPVLSETFLRGLTSEQLLVALVALPLALNATFTTGIVLGRQSVRWYGAVNVIGSLVTTALLALVLGGLGSSVLGALAVYLAASAVQTGGMLLGARRATAPCGDTGPASYRQILAYGLPFYPASLTSFFSYRIDAYLITFLMTDAAEPLGFYSLAVGLAEMLFFLPNAISAVFFPHVAGSSRADANRQVPVASRVTLLVTAVFTAMLIPGAIAMIVVLLPAFAPSIEPFLILLPGVVTLGVTKVVGGFITGIGRPGVGSWVSVSSLAVNVAANLILIPSFGINGAAAASLVSYTLSALLITAIAARLTQTRLSDYWIPRASDARFAIATSIALARRVLRRGAAGADQPGLPT